MDDFLFAAALIILANIAVSTVRILKGPTHADRMMGAQLVGTGGVAVLVLLSPIQQQPATLDVALLLALLAALAAAAFVKSLSREGAGDPEEEEQEQEA